VRSGRQPGLINEVCGITYSQFTLPDHVSLKGDPYQVGAENNNPQKWMELITPGTAEVLASYAHPVWGKYAAITRNKFGKGTATYVGFMPTPMLIGGIMDQALKNAGLWSSDQQLAFPLITKKGTNAQGKVIRYYFNYSASAVSFTYPHKSGKELIGGQSVSQDQQLTLPAWDFKIIEEQ